MAEASVLILDLSPVLPNHCVWLVHSGSLWKATLCYSHTYEKIEMFAEGQTPLAATARLLESVEK